MSQKQLFGGVIKPYWDRNKIRATLVFDKKFTPEAFLQQVRLAVSGIGKIMENSIGFYYQEDRTPGRAPDVNTGKMRSYDYVMRDIVIDHVAAGAFTGRCTAPSCGLGLDVMMRRVTTDPFGEYKNMAECIKANQGKKKNPAAHCAWLHKQTTGLWPGQNARDSALFNLIGDTAVMDRGTYFLIFGDTSQPSKCWMRNCKVNARSFGDKAQGFCNWLYHHGSNSMKKSFGTDLRVHNKRRKKQMSKNMEKKTPEQLAKEFESCVTQRMNEMPQLTREAAEALCMPATKPQDEPTPPGGTLDQEEQSEYQKCITEQMKKEGMTMEKAIEICKAKGDIKTDQDAAFENCVSRKMEEGMSREDAEKECRKEHPLEPKKEDQEPEPTELEKCVKTRMETTENTEEEARAWCEAELAGEHEKAEDLISRNKRLLSLKRRSDIRKQREKRRRV